MGFETHLCLWEAVIGEDVEVRPATDRLQFLKDQQHVLVAVPDSVLCGGQRDVDRGSVASGVPVGRTQLVATRVGHCYIV